MLCNLSIALFALPESSDLFLASTWRYVAHNALHGLRHGILLFLIIYSIERCYNVRTSQYKSRNFLHDICYWICGRSDLFRILFTASLFKFLGNRLAFIEITSFRSLPALVRLPIYFIFADFLTYWIHRWQHSSRLLWAFHSMHHSQEQLTFATSMRTHPVDDFMLTTFSFVPLMLLGQPVRLWLPVYIAMEFMIAILHSEIPWRFGPLYRVFVSPTFHSLHHSIRPEHYNQNFGRLLSIWDYLFGTAVREQTRPDLYGLRDCEMPTLVSQLCSPFIHLYREIPKSIRGGNSGQVLTHPDSAEDAVLNANNRKADMP